MKRRDFITKSTLVTTGVIAGTSTISAFSYTNNSMKPISIGIIGTGDRGSGIIPTINSIEGFIVKAVCDVLPFRLKEGLEKSNNKAVAYNNYKELLKDKNIDAVVIATPYGTHGQIALDALQAKKHVYCEKTMARGLETINQIKNKVAKSNLIFQTGHQYHSSKLFNHIVDIIKKGEIGDISYFECQWNRNSDWRKPVNDPTLERVINWRLYRENSGGPTAELSSHQIDFVNWVLNDTPHKIMGIGGIDYWKDGRETFDNIHLIHEYKNGVKAKYTSVSSNATDGFQIKVFGSKATLVIKHHEAWIYYENENNSDKIYKNVDAVSGATNTEGNRKKGHKIEVTDSNPTKQAFIDFKNAIINNKHPLSNALTGGDTAKAIQLSLDAMYNEEIVYWN